MASAFIWALIAASSLLVGGLLALWFKIGKRTLGAIMGFGAGVLISAVAYELVFEAVHEAGFTGFPALGFFIGAITFFVSDKLIGSIGGGERKSVNASHQSSMVVPLVLGIILDGIPESVVIGLGITVEVQLVWECWLRYLSLIYPKVLQAQQGCDQEDGAVLK